MSPPENADLARASARTGARTRSTARRYPPTATRSSDPLGRGPGYEAGVLAFPPPLRPGDKVAVVAPSGPLPLDDFWRGLAWVRARYRVKMRSGALSRTGYLAGDDARREDELRGALEDRDVKAVIAGRGGYGSMRLIEGLNAASFAGGVSWIVGFSDITALHVVAGRAGIASIHGPNVTGLGKTSPANRAAWLLALERPHDPAAWTGLAVMHPGRAKGPVSGGNLALLEAMAAAGMLDLPQGCILFLEDVDERPYRIDRMLTALRLGGHLRRAAAIVFGSFGRCDPGKDGVTVESVLRERTHALGVPVLADAPFGHGDENRAFVLGSTAEVLGSSVTFCGR